MADLSDTEINYKPTITKSEFDGKEEGFKKAFISLINHELEAKKESLELLDKGKTEEKKKAFGGLAIPISAVVDSKMVMTVGSSSIRDELGADIDPKDIKKGGWASAEEAWNDLSGKIRERCLADNLGDEDAPPIQVSSETGC